MISGRVQGVGFRQSTRAQARDYLSLRGWVKNLPDGRVEAVFQGEDTEVLAMIEWCQMGPRLAAVTHLEVIEEPVQEQFSGFEIKNGK